MSRWGDGSDEVETRRPSFPAIDCTPHLLQVPGVEMLTSPPTGAGTAERGLQGEAVWW